MALQAWKLGVYTFLQTLYIHIQYFLNYEDLPATLFIADG